MEDQIPEHVKRERFDRLMALQKEITREWNQTRPGSVLKVLIEEHEKEGNVYLGRTEADAPEVDGQVFVLSQAALKTCAFVPVRITDAFDVDLCGDAIAG